MKIYKIGLLGSLVLLSGCTMFQESHYANYSGPDGNVVMASGRAAEVSARYNSTYNCPSCTNRPYSEARHQRNINRATRSFGAMVADNFNQALTGDKGYE